MLVATQKAQKPSQFLQVDLELIQHSGRTAALIFAVVQQAGDGGSTIAEIRSALSLGESTVRRTLAKLEAVGVVDSDQEDSNSSKTYFTEYGSFSAFLDEEKYFGSTVTDALIGEAQDKIDQAITDAQVIS